MKDLKKVSIIIPVYNCEKTLIQCLGNVVNQTLKDIEIILVNDASTDSTWNIILECEKQFPEIIMAINLETNRGAGGARNVGLMYATGEYIGFVDSDDIIAVDMYEKLYNEAVRGNYDMVDCGYYNEEKDLAIVHTSDELTGDLDSAKRRELIVSGGYLWSRIFRRSLITDSDIRFREKVILEDCEYLMYMFAKAKRIGNVKEILYNYRYFKNSLSKSFNVIKYYDNATAAMDAVYNAMSPLPDYDELKMAVEYAIFRLASLCINLCFSYGKNEKMFSIEKGLAGIRDRINQYISIPYQQNKYIINKIPAADLELIKKVI